MRVVLFACGVFAFESGANNALEILTCEASALRPRAFICALERDSSDFLTFACSSARVGAFGKLCEPN